MKRRLFLKTGTVGAAGIIAIPTMLYGCSIVDGGYPTGPAAGISLFQENAELFDSAIAELRLQGSGNLASAEAEDVDLAGLSEQIAERQAAVPAELAEEFAESSTQMLAATTALAASVPEMSFPLAGAEQAEMAEDFALLKVWKASTLLASAAAETPHPIRKVHAAEKMVESAEFVHSSINANAESEFINATGELNAHAEEYVGSAEAWSAAEGFELGVHNYGESARKFARKRHLDGGKDLLTSSDNIALSTGYFAEGIDNLNAEAEYFNSHILTSSAEMIPFSAELVAESEIFQHLAQGESAEMGADKMVDGATEIYNDAESNVTKIGRGGAELDLGADQFIAGTVTFVSAGNYTNNAFRYMRAAEDLAFGGWPARAEKAIEISTELMVPNSEHFYAGSEALQAVELTGGVESLVPALSEVLEGAEFMAETARSIESEIGAAEALSGAEMAEEGAIKAASNPAKFLESGAESVELGTISVMKGAAEFIEGYY